MFIGECKGLSDQPLRKAPRPTPFTIHRRSGQPRSLQARLGLGRAFRQEHAVTYYPHLPLSCQMSMQEYAH